MAKTIYKKKVKNGKEYYFYRLRHKNLAKPKDIYGATVKELDDKIKALVNELNYGVGSNKDFFETFLCNWLFDVHCMNVKPSTKERYEGIYRNYIKDSPISSIKIKELTSLDIQDYYNGLIKKGKSVNVIKNLHKVIAPCIRYAYDTNMIIKDFSRSIVLPKETEDNKLNKKNDVKPLSVEDQKLFVKAIEGHELEMLFLTALNTGMRQGELFALSWNDIDMKNNTITISKTLKYISEVSKEGRGKCAAILQTPKSKNSNRTISIPVALTNRLKQHKLKQKATRLKVGDLYEDNTLVFCTSFGKCHNSSNVLKRFKNIINDIGLQDRKFHDLRHTYATRLFELGEDAKTVQQILGHSNISITLDTYTHVSDIMKRKAAEKLNDLYTLMGAK